VAAPTASRTPNGIERKSLTQECGWKGGDRGGLAERKDRKTKERALFTLDTDRPSHGRRLNAAIYKDVKY
jgi:hypothetical protein